MSLGQVPETHLGFQLLSGDQKEPPWLTQLSQGVPTKPRQQYNLLRRYPEDEKERLELLHRFLKVFLPGFTTPPHSSSGKPQVFKETRRVI